MNNRLRLEPSAAMPRQLVIAKTSDTWTVGFSLPETHFNAVFAIGEQLRVTRSYDTPVLWLGDTAFDLVEAEAKRICEFYDLPFPVKPAAMGVNPPSPAPVVAGPSSEHRA